jgi:exodeoxyribonuclease VII large subunit
MSIAYRVNLQKNHLEGTQKRLEALSPLAVLARGYAVVTRKADGGVVSRVAQAKPGQQIRVRVVDGQFDAEVTE